MNWLLVTELTVLATAVLAFTIPIAIRRRARRLAATPPAVASAPTGAPVRAAGAAPPRVLPPAIAPRSQPRDPQPKIQTERWVAAYPHWEFGLLRTEAFYYVGLDDDDVITQVLLDCGYPEYELLPRRSER